MIGFLAAMAASSSPGLLVSLNASDSIGSRGLGTASAGVEFNSSGEEFGSSVVGSFVVNRDNWLDIGSASSVWLERSVTGDALNWQDAGSSRVQLNTTRQYGNQQSVVGTTSSVVTFSAYDASTGGSLLDSVTITIEATRT